MKVQSMIKLCAVLISVLLLFTMVAGCSEEPDDSTDGSGGEGGVTTTTSAGDVLTTSTNASSDGGDSTTTTDGGQQGLIPGLIVTTTKATTTESQPIPTNNTTRPTSVVTKDIWSKIPADLKGQKLTVLTWWQVGDNDKKRAEEFQEKTGITVNFRTASLEDYQTTLASMSMANNAPGLAAIINEWFPQPITRGLFHTIDAGAFDLTDPIYDKEIMDQFKFNDKYYAVAVKGSTMTTFEVVFWNKTMFKNAGMKTTPETLWQSNNWNWETCRDLALQMTNHSTGQYGMTLNYQNYWMLSAGTDFVKVDPKEGIVNNAKDPAIYDAWKWGWDMMFTYKVVDPSAVGAQNFYSGKSAMYAVGTFMMQANMGYMDENMKDEWGVVPFPSPKGQDFVAACEGSVWGIPSRIDITKEAGQKKAHAASWFLRYWLDPNYHPKDMYAYDWCQEFLDWIWEQPKQSMNSSGVLTYGGEYSTEAMQLSLMDNSSSHADIRSNIDSWYGVFDANIKKIKTEMG